MHISGRDARKHNGSADVAWTRLGIRQGNRCTFIFDFTEQSKCWPRVHDDKDADMVLELARSISAARRLKEGACWAQMVEYGSPSGDERELDESRIKCFLHLFQTELTGFFAFLGGTVLLKRRASLLPLTSGSITMSTRWVQTSLGSIWDLCSVPVMTSKFQSWERLSATYGFPNRLWFLGANTSTVSP